MATSETSNYEFGGVDGYTREFIESVHQELDYDSLEVSENSLGGLNPRVYGFSRDAFDTYLSISATDSYDDILFYHVIEPGNHTVTSRWSAERLAEEAGFSADQEGQAYTQVRPGIVRKENQPNELVSKIESVDKALYRNAVGDSFHSINQDLQNELEDVTVTQKIWRKAKKELGI